MTPTSILRAARAMIERPECWIKKSYRLDENGHRCLPPQARNDAPERTHADVLAAFDAAVERAEGRS